MGEFNPIFIWGSFTNSFWIFSVEIAPSDCPIHDWPSHYALKVNIFYFPQLISVSSRKQKRARNAKKNNNGPKLDRVKRYEIFQRPTLSVKVQSDSRYMFLTRLEEKFLNSAGQNSDASAIQIPCQIY